MKTCIDLKRQFGQRYQITCEESYDAERGERARGHDPWLLTIPCRFGHIYPHGGKLLGASTNCRGPVANRLAALPGVRVVQVGHDGINVVFHVNHFAQVAKIIRPRCRRSLSPKKRAEQTERLRQYRFRRATQIAPVGQQCDAA